MYLRRRKKPESTNCLMAESTLEVAKMQFSWANKRPCNSGSQMTVWELQLNGAPVCDYVSWSFTSCGIDSFQRMNTDPINAGVFNDQEKFNALCEFLEENSPPHAGWEPKEFYACLSTTQKSSGNFNILINDERVKEVDTFMNKAHGPNAMHLFRLSLEKDFPKMEKKKTAVKPNDA